MITWGDKLSLKQKLGIFSFLDFYWLFEWYYRNIGRRLMFKIDYWKYKKRTNQNAVLFFEILAFYVFENFENGILRKLSDIEIWNLLEGNSY